MKKVLNKLGPRGKISKNKKLIEWNRNNFHLLRVGSTRDPYRKGEGANIGKSGHKELLRSTPIKEITVTKLRAQAAAKPSTEFLAYRNVPFSLGRHLYTGYRPPRTLRRISCP